VDLFFKFSAINCVYRYVPNELRGGMISLSLAPANAAILLFLIQVCSSLSLSLSLSIIENLKCISLFKALLTLGMALKISGSCILLVDWCGKPLVD